MLDDEGAVVTPSTIRTISPEDGDLIVQSDNTAGINASLDTSTIAEGGGGNTVAIGASVAFNSVGIDGQNILFNLADTFVGTTVATPNPSSATARVARSTVDVAEDVIVDADNNTTIKSEIVNAAVATGVSIADKSNAVAVGMVIAMNRVASDTTAEIVDAPSVIAQDGLVKVTSDDVAAVEAAVTAATVSASVGAGGAKSVSVAASFARNEITSNADAAILRSDVEAETDLTVAAIRNAQIDAKGLSAAVAVGLTAGGGSGGDVSFSGGGAVAFNSIRGQAAAKAADSTLDAKGTILVDAKSISAINATVLAASVSGMINIGGSGTTAVGIGASYVDNMIGYDQSTPDLTGETVLNTTQRVTTVNTGTYVQGTEGSPVSGHTYKYIGTAPRQVQDENGGVLANGVDLALEDYSDTNLWERVGLQKAANATALASVDNVQTTDTTPAKLSVTALAAQTINATAAAAAVALAGSTANATAVAGGGAAARNRIAGGAVAEVTGTNTDITVGAAEVLARDASTINSLVGAAAVSAAVSGKSAVSLSIGIALAFNDVANEVAARIVGADVTATGADGVKVEAVTAPPESFSITGNSTVTAANLDDLAQEEVDADGNDINGDAAGDGNVLTALVGLIDAEIAGDTVGSTVSNLSDLVFTESEDGNGWTLIDGLGRKISLATGTGNTFDVEIGTINAVSGAAAFALGGGKTGVAIAGAGAYSENVVQSNTTAYLDAATVTATGGNVDIDATNKSAINAITVAAAMSVGLGKTGVGVSIGAAISQNLIGREARGAGDPIGTSAYIKNSDVSASGDVSVDALSEQKINALNVAGSVAIAGGKIGVAISGSGVYVRNVIDTETSAKIIGDVGLASPAAVDGENVTVKAQNKSDINVIAATVSVSAAFGKAAVAVSMGATVAENQIYGLTTAQIVDSNDGGVQARTGDVLVEANDMARINAVAAAGALAIAGGAAGIGVALAGALAFNRIGAGVSATVENSLVTATAGDVSILASADGRIDALNGAVSAAIAAGGTGVGVAIGAAFVSNQIGYGYGALVADYNSSQTVNAGDITNGTTVRINSGINEGRTFQYIGDARLEPNVDTNGDWEITAPGDNIPLIAVDYNNPEQWVEVNLAKDAVLVTAGAMNSDINAGGDLLIDAQSNQKINAASLAVAAAMAFGGTGVGVSASGASVLNRIASSPLAFISGKLSTGVSAGTVTVQADDESTINAASVAGALSVAGGSTGVAVALGVSVAYNTVENAVTAKIDNSATVVATSAVGDNSVLVRAGSATQNAESPLSMGGLTAAQLDDAAGTELETVQATIEEVVNGVVTMVTKDVERAVASDVSADNAVLATLKTALEANYTVEGALRISVVSEGQYWVVVDESGTAWNITRDGANFSAQRVTINALSGAVSLAAGFGSAGIAIAGAGAFGQNVVLTNVDAHIDSATVTANAEQCESPGR
ncbi:hypothetical protein QTO30_13540 [Yoonia sp. GPGPB17]|uniref:beta strand repeat-containing protein n=1 Tax=Yoonia sp. GPGPB17 TaxID=3026147 RepID=UPI0030BDAFCC